MEVFSYQKYRENKGRLSLITLFIALFFISGCEGEKTDLEYLASAKNYAAKGELKAYEIELKNALQKNPVNGEARLLLGRQYLANQLGALAQKELERAIEYGIPAADVASDLLQAMYYQFQFKELLEFDAQTESLDKADQAQVYLYRGLARIKLNQNDMAQEEFDKAVKADEASAPGQLASAYMLALLNKIDEARSATDEILSNNPNHTETLILQNRLSLAAGETEASIEAIDKAIKLEPRRLDLYVTSALTYILNKQNEEAEKRIDTVLENAPNHLYSNLIKARLRLQAKDWEEARSHAEAALAQSEVSKEAKLISGIANFYLQNWELARDRLLSVRNFIKPDHIAHRMFSYTEFKLGYIESADAIRSSVGELQPGDEKLLSSFGQELVREGKMDEAVSLFETAAGLNPDNSEILARLGILKLQQNDQTGLEDLEKVLELDASSFWTRAAMARNYVRQGKAEEAINIAQELADNEPENIEGYILLADVYAALEQHEEAEATLQKALDIDQNSKVVYARLFQLAVRNEDFKLAREHNEKILSFDPINSSALVNHYRLEKQSGDPKKALARINKVIDDNPDNEELKFISAMFYLDGGEMEKARSIMRSFKEDSGVYASAQSILGNLHLRSSDFEQAIPYFQEWVKAAPQNPKSHQSLIAAYIGTNQMQDALQATRNAAGVVPNSRNFALMEIRMLLATGRKQQAISKANKLNLETGTKDPQLEFLFGQYYASNKDYAAALKHLETMHSLAPTSRSIISVAEVTNLSGNKEESMKLLSDWLEENPDNQPVRLYLANLKMNGDNSDAIDEYRRLVEENDKNFIALNNLAWALGEQGQISEAINFAEKANRLRPNTPQILDTLGFLLLKRGDIEKARETLESAYELDSENPEIMFHFALALKEAGDISSAREKLTAVASMDFPKAQQARELLEKIN